MAKLWAVVPEQRFLIDDDVDPDWYNSLDYNEANDYFDPELSDLDIEAELKLEEDGD